MPLAIQNVYPEVIRNTQLNLLFIIYIVMNTLMDYITIHLKLI